MIEQGNISEAVDFGFSSSGKAETRKPLGMTNARQITEAMATTATWKIGDRRPNSRFPWKVDFGPGIEGDISVEATLLGNQKLTFRKLVRVPGGDLRWTCERVENIPPSDDLTSFDIEERIRRGLAEAASAGEGRSSPELPHRLFEDIAHRLKRANSPIFRMAGWKRTSDDGALFEFNPNGFGGGLMGQRILHKLIIEARIDPELKLLRVTGTEVSSPIGQSRWEQEPSEFDELFSIDRDSSRIALAIEQMFMMY